MVLLFQQGQGRIHGARAGGVGAAATLFDGLDDFIAVAGADFNQRQHDQRQVAAAEDALGPFAATSSTWTTGAAMAHAVAALVEAARTTAMHEVFVAVFAVMVVVMLAAMAVFCVM
jgi:cytochrome b